MAEDKKYIKVIDGGPYLVFGISEATEEIITPDEEGDSLHYTTGKKYVSEKEPMALCRCGRSSNRPFCNGTHAKNRWDCEESANFEPIINEAEIIKGPNLTLLDNEEYCSYVRFCDRKGRIWNLISEGSKEADELCKQEMANCSSGRLMLKDNHSNEYFEPKFAQTISLITDAPIHKMGPIWVKGGVEVQNSQGESYEIRNRQTLCRCGESRNKPFCDGSHAL